MILAFDVLVQLKADSEIVVKLLQEFVRGSTTILFVPPNSNARIAVLV